MIPEVHMTLLWCRADHCARRAVSPNGDQTKGVLSAQFFVFCEASDGQQRTINVRVCK